MNPTTIKEWHKPGFMLSTDRSLLSIPALMKAFASDDLYWAAELDEGGMQLLINNSFCFGLYQLASVDSDSTATSKLEKTESQIGFARFVTDYTTFAYMADVYVLPAYRGRGLGAWMVGCCAEMVEGVPTLRRTMLITSASESEGGGMEALYERYMGMRRFENGKGGAVVMNKNGGGFVGRTTQS